jgi:hypothetical protein
MYSQPQKHCNAFLGIPKGIKMACEGPKGPLGPPGPPPPGPPPPPPGPPMPGHKKRPNRRFEAKGRFGPKGLGPKEMNR